MGFVGQLLVVCLVVAHRERRHPNHFAKKYIQRARLARVLHSSSRIPMYVQANKQTPRLYQTEEVTVKLLVIGRFARQRSQI